VKIETQIHRTPDVGNEEHRMAWERLRSYFRINSEQLLWRQ
jgi:hypothetical protein